MINSWALSLTLCSLLRQHLINSSNSLLIPSGKTGKSWLKPIFMIACTGLSNSHSAQGGTPLHISSKRQPNDQISLFVPYYSCFIISGDIQGIDPFISCFSSEFRLVRVREICLEQPKSRIFSRSAGETKMLLPFKSLWIILCECRHISPRSICWEYSFISGSENDPEDSSFCWMVCPCMYSK